MQSVKLQYNQKNFYTELLTNQDVAMQYYWKSQQICNHIRMLWDQRNQWQMQIQ